MRVHLSACALRTALLLAACGGLLAGGGQAAAQSPDFDFSVDRADYDFAQVATFTLQLKSTQVLTDLWLQLEPGNAPAQVYSVPISVGRTISTTFSLDLQANPLPPFAQVAYRWRIQTVTGRQELFEAKTFFYSDDRYEWQRLHTETVDVLWAGDSASLAQSVVDAVDEALPRLTDQLGVGRPQALQAYIYNSPEDLRAALLLSGRSWVAGHADPGLGVMLLAVRPGPEAADSLVRDTRHELTHVLVYQASRGSFGQVPSWLNEGLAVNAEGSLSPAYTVALERAVSDDRLLPLASLCGRFADDAGQAELSYAESASLVRYIRERFGYSGLRRLLVDYGDGVACESGPAAALDTSLPDLERDWRASLLTSTAPGQSGAGPALPWLLILAGVSLVILIPILMTTRAGARASGPEPAHAEGP